MAALLADPAGTAELMAHKPKVMSEISAMTNDVKGTLVARDEEVDVVAAGLLSGTSVLLMGPPGTAKSLLVRSVAQASGVSGPGFFDYLISSGWRHSHMEWDIDGDPARGRRMGAYPSGQPECDC